jgi:adenylate cyclase
VFVRMGIHTGDAIVGNIGRAWKKIEYTAIGDTVNTASRLEWINKVYGTKICVSEQIALGLVNSEFVFRKLDKVRVKWKLQTTFLYELIGKKQNLSSQEKERIEVFEKALVSYIDWDFQNAKVQFQNAKELWDSVANIFLERIESYQWNPPNNWEGIYTAQDK